MRTTSFAIFSGLIAVASAHFQLQFPTPRGPFIEPQEINFCDSYSNSVSNRTEFPLNGGFISLNSEHPQWTLGVLLSTLENPQNFANFSVAVPFFQVEGEGAFCFPVDFQAAGLSGVTDGANVTIQLEFDGGDGLLFQCADLTLKSDFTVNNSSISCTNATGDTVQTLTSSEGIPTGSAGLAVSSSTSGASSTTSSAPASTSSSAALAQSAIGVSGFLGFAGFLLSLL